MGNVQAIIDLSEELYLSLSASGLTKEKIAGESRKLLALKCFKEKAHRLYILLLDAEYLEAECQDKAR